MEREELRYLERLADLYPSVAAASTELINLEAILNLPKGTEHFLTDIHGEYEAFAHVLKNGSGSVRRKVNDVFSNTLSEKDKQALATLIYYPREKMEQLINQASDRDEWCRITMYRLIEICKRAASKYTRSKVRKAMPPEFAYVLEELLTGKGDGADKTSYYNAIVDTIVRVGRGKECIVAMCQLIQRLVVDHLRIVGDIYDRGPGPHRIMDKLMDYHSVDIQWGNHDVLWMGAAAGQPGCIANVIRICARYGNLDILEDGYGINLLPLATFAINVYGDDPCSCFQLKGDNVLNQYEAEVNVKLHKAISIIQFKAEGQIIGQHPELHLESRNLLHRIHFEEGTIEIGGKEYALLDKNFPTVNPQDPYAYTPMEADIMERLIQAFKNCEKLQRHVRFLLAKGGLYKIYNGNLLYHGCIPLNQDGSLKEVEYRGARLRGRALYDALENDVRRAVLSEHEEERAAFRDVMWYIWLHPDSPLFGKDKMATFERYFLADKETHREKKNPYYQLLENEIVVDGIMKEFGLDPETAHIINGHVPVKSRNGENPVKCGGKVLVIDGGFSKAYQAETGIAGYSLTYNSYGLILAALEPFESTEAAIEHEIDIKSDSIIVQRVSQRKLVGDTDTGRVLREKITDLERLLAAYRSGEILERVVK